MPVFLCCGCLGLLSFVVYVGRLRQTAGNGELRGAAQRHLLPLGVASIGCIELPHNWQSLLFPCVCVLHRVVMDEHEDIELEIASDDAIEGPSTDSLTVEVPDQSQAASAPVMGEEHAGERLPACTGTGLDTPEYWAGPWFAMTDEQETPVSPANVRKAYLHDVHWQAARLARWKVRWDRANVPLTLQALAREAFSEVLKHIGAALASVVTRQGGFQRPFDDALILVADASVFVKVATQGARAVDESEAVQAVYAAAEFVLSQPYAPEHVEAANHAMAAAAD